MCFWSFSSVDTVPPQYPVTGLKFLNLCVSTASRNRPVHLGAVHVQARSCLNHEIKGYTGTFNTKEPHQGQGWYVNRQLESSHVATAPARQCPLPMHVRVSICLIAWSVMLRAFPIISQVAHGFND